MIYIWKMDWKQRVRSFFSSRHRELNRVYKSPLIIHWFYHAPKDKIFIHFIRADVTIKIITDLISHEIMHRIICKEINWGASDKLDNIDIPGIGLCA